MIGQYDNLGRVWVRHEIHGSSHPFEDFPWNHVVCQIAIRSDLQGSKHRDVDVAAANHAEGL